MRVTVVPGRALSADHVAVWRELLAADTTLSSPLLCPEFTLAVSRAREDVFVGVIEHAGAITGFFPFQRSRFATGIPVGGMLNDLQGVVVERGLDWNGVDLIRSAGLRQWRYSRLLGSQTPFAPSHHRRLTSAFMDFSGGYEAYAAQKQQAGIDPDKLQQVDRKARKLAREVGSLRFELRSADTKALAALLKWKFDRYASRGYPDVFAIPWTRRLIEEIHATETIRFAGILTVLYAGDHLVAAHMGMRSQRLLHWWFPAYSPQFARYSPGLILLLMMARQAAAGGLHSIELGSPEGYPYKQFLMNRSIGLAAGTVDRVPFVGAARRWAHSSEDWIRSSPVLRSPARTMARAVRRLRDLL